MGEMTAHTPEKRLLTGIFLHHLMHQGVRAAGLDLILGNPSNSITLYIMGVGMEIA